MKYPEIPLAQSILQICKAKGLKNIIISPGSRNAPLTIGFSIDPFFNCYSIADERCAAFFALGIAQQTLEPAILVCTSGSALLNYYPAIAEAFYSQIPLIVISADRPTTKIDIGDGQTIRQRNVFENHSLFNANLEDEASSKNDLLIQEAIRISYSKKGPVHINAPFEEPLYNTVDETSYKPLITHYKPERKPEINFDLYKAVFQNTKKKLVLIGVQNPNVLSEEILQKLGNDPSIVVMTEITSNVSHPNFVSNIDTLITSFTEEDFENFKPELLISIGGMVVSKRIKALLRKYKPNAHWHVDEHRFYDTFQALTNEIETNPQTFFEAMFADNHFLESSYNDSIKTIMKSRAIGHEKYLKEIPYSDFMVFDQIWKHLPSHIQLQISNSSAIRYAQLFKTPSEIDVFCNRGTSGIDGSTSTAIGAAVANNKPTVLITGDISFLYDSNALWNNYIPENFKIILINNGGGGIFRILPGHNETPVFNTFFETEHCLTAEHLAKMYRFDYETIANETELSPKLKAFFNSKNKGILEIFTPTKINQDILKQYFKAVTI
ncbi:2-succinyl-5-enolpyruvyl-6-hydroxy-3-cyclohexene-1-carboxylic-acid synthase [Paenimyroides tangerinum]|uniref:2-succinyl-5-enolpyruvyl-6-hydroxy-3-cyclohexene-1-carboxylate synthase n=1 Tax=Paenimyroides tangerinum TaxID=2488728 RepID=A0A3P3W6U5_9FLAO|nr:2-succinyl-5-enolpyruvyl-6-hydroxy-3-cyclohexene-1-carboxylic-acid synthase [Paenimyroides tangerinum]RRJ89339.1 2-succinyl-5-enolpyruvyl-6-hydroxy-3-cyclohexene-1-carboxylic-acid synthase [Paenimyroides tangerinum]